jgi:hypothetical protein
VIALSCLQPVGLVTPIEAFNRTNDDLELRQPVEDEFLDPVRSATADDAMALRRLAAASGARPLEGRVLVAEVGGVLAAAISRDERRTIADPTLAPAHLTTVLRLHADALAAVARQPSLAERMREAVAAPSESALLPLAA